jgi:hypothetical protein
MIDSEVDKVIDFTENSIVLKPYELNDVKFPAQDKQNQILMECRDYLFKLLDSTEDVRTYLKNNKPTFSLLEKLKASEEAK